MGQAISLFSFLILNLALTVEDTDRECRLILTSIAVDRLSELNGPPAGKLIRISHPKARASQPSLFVRDEKGVVWYLKKDIHHPELQTGAEVISAWVYRHFGFYAPETYIVEFENGRYSASLKIPDGKDTELIDDMPKDSRWRSMRIIAAFLKDYDRLRIGPNNRILTDGSIALYDFGGTLGARAQGEIKPGQYISNALGSYGPSDDLSEIFSTFDVSWLPQKHPWNLLNLDDYKQAVEGFRTLDHRRITEIVELARYSVHADSSKMVDALQSRRNAILDRLIEFVYPDVFYPTHSYWATKTSRQDLNFNVNKNRPSKISSDIKMALKSLHVPEDHMILFRGQSQLTNEVLSPYARLIAGQQATLNEEAFRQLYLSKLRKIRDDNRFRGTLPFWRNEQYKLLSLHFSEDPDILYHNTVWWDRATPVDALAMYHSESDGYDLFISATRNLAIASRYVNFPRVTYRYRYVYVLLVPTDRIIPVHEITQNFRGAPNPEEEETVILYDATPFIHSIYDTETNEFIDL